MGIKKGTRNNLSELVPLLREIYPDMTAWRRAIILTEFSALHDWPAADLDQSHIDVLFGTLRYWARLGGISRSRDWKDAPAWPGVEDVCAGCRDFKALMVEIHADVKIRTDAEGHVVSPITVEDRDSLGLSLSEAYKDWIVHGGPAAERG